MEAQQIKLLSHFIHLLKTNPEILHTPQLQFFKEWLLSLGARIPDVCEEAKISPDADSVTEDSESEIEFDEFDILPEEEVSDLEAVDDCAEINDDAIDQANEKRGAAQAKFSEGNYEEALKLYSEAIKLNHSSALFYARRAAVYIKMNKPSHAIRDCNKAISLNPDSAPPYKWRGFANKSLGKWKDAYMDLQMSLKLDYSDDALSLLKEIEPNYKRIFEHNRKQEHKKQSKLQQEREERLKRVQEAQEKARKEAENNPGPNLMGDNLGSMFSDPELMSCMKDPEIMKAFTEIFTNPEAMYKYKDNPKIQKVMKKMGNLGGGMSGMPGCMPGGMPSGGMPFSNGADQTCPDLD